jgi:hypothetical protein
MNEAKVARLESGLNGMAKKVLDAVPAQSPWSKDQIAIEIRRRGSGADRSVLDGCLDSLRGRGLIKEPARGQFIRVVGKTTTTQPEENTLSIPLSPARVPVSALAAPQVEKDPLARLAAASKLLRQAADEIDAAALDAAEQVQSAAKDTEKFRQLQALLKG